MCTDIYISCLLFYRFRDLAQGILPQEEELSSGEEPLGDIDIKLAVDRMQHFEATLNGKRKKGKNKSERRKEDSKTGVTGGKLLRTMVSLALEKMKNLKKNERSFCGRKKAGNFETVR